MRIECDKCAAKYSIADDKVRGKTFKIRCKKCSNVIIVRDKAAGAESAAADGGGEDEQEQAAPGWHLAIDGETVGPLSEADVRQRYNSGQIDKSTSTWQEGFDDWVELGAIEAFADLPDRAAAPVGRAAMPAAVAPRGDDPFAASGDDAFSASSGEYGAHSSGSHSSHSSPVAAAAESPRVSAASALTGQRNENSVLFSLDSLRSVATARPASAGPVRQAPSTTAPSSEGSGLIDIRAMGAMLGGGGGGGGGSSFDASPGEDEVLPSFGGGGLGGLSVEPLAMEAPSAATAAPSAPQRSNVPMYLLIGVLLVGLLGLGAFIVFQDDKPPEQVIKEVQVPGNVDVKAEEEDDKGKDDEEEKGDEEKDDEAAAAEETAGETEGPVADTGGGTTSSGKKPIKKNNNPGDPKPSDPKPSDPKPADPKPGSKEPDVDCLLNPSLAKCKGGGDKSGDKPKPAGDPSLPKKLGTTEISKGIAGVKDSAKACGPKNGAAGGTGVAIKFSVTGSTGSVSSATATGEHAGSALGKCVEAAAKKATFPKFQDPSQGFQFTFRM